VAVVWVSNPFTIPPMFYFAYKVGAWILGIPVRELHFVLSWQWLAHEIAVLWKPLLLGSVICGAVLAVLGNIAVRLLWRWWVSAHWRRRRAKRLAR